MQPLYLTVGHFTLNQAIYLNLMKGGAYLEIPIMVSLYKS